MIPSGIREKLVGQFLEQRLRRFHVACGVLHRDPEARVGIDGAGWSRGRGERGLAHPVEAGGHRLAETPVCLATNDRPESASTETPVVLR